MGRSRKAKEEEERRRNGKKKSRKRNEEQEKRGIERRSKGRVGGRGKEDKVVEARMKEVGKNKGRDCNGRVEAEGLKKGNREEKGRGKEEGTESKKKGGRIKEKRVGNKNMKKR